MRFFDRFKKSPDSVRGPDQIAEAYSNFVNAFISWMACGDLAPVAAYENIDGAFTGHIYVQANPTYTSRCSEGSRKGAYPFRRPPLTHPSRFSDTRPLLREQTRRQPVDHANVDTTRVRVVDQRYATPVAVHVHRQER